MCLLFVPMFPPSKSTKITKNHQNHQNLKNKNVPNKCLKLLKHLAKSTKISKKSQGFPVIARFWRTTRWRFSNPELKPTSRPALGSRHRSFPSPENMGYPGCHEPTMTPISGFTWVYYIHFLIDLDVGCEMLEHPEDSNHWFLLPQHASMAQKIAIPDTARYQRSVPICSQKAG